MSIRVLPPEVVNQIAAGEVVERPFSVVKELVENSLDAGAQRVHVELEDGGRALIRVRDDGGGFAADDLPLAFVSHATSKLSVSSDLDHIASLGFRGEALASIGSVARTKIVSRQPAESSGAEIRCDGGAIGDARPCGAPPGTLIEVRDLFFNVPARRRFLRTPAAEKARIQDLLVRLSLARLDVDFALSVDGKRVLHLPAGESLRDRVRRAFGARLVGELLDVSRGSGDYVVEGLTVHPDGARRDSTLELLYVNGRNARDKSATHAVRQAYRAFTMGGKYPIYFLMLSMPPDAVDVNVHPTKAELRFLEGRRVAGLLHDAVLGALESRAASRSGPALAVGEDKPRARSGFPDLPRDLFGRASGGPPPLPEAAPGRPAGRRAAGGPGPSAGKARSEPRPAAGGRVERREPEPAAAAPGLEAAAEPAPRANPFARLASHRFLSVMNLYLVLEGEDGLVVVDQHALHERVVFEELQQRDAASPRTVQRLLVPEVLELTAADKAYLLEARDVLAAEGFLVEDFGGGSVAIQGVPAVLGKARPAALVESFLLGDVDDDARPRAREAILERFHSRACRSSVMAGDALCEEEIEALLVAAAKLRHPHNCPHGRPTVLTFDRAELERFFRRRL